MNTTEAHNIYTEKMRESKKLIDRLNKGKKLIDKRIQANEITVAYEAMQLYHTLANELYHLQEECVLLHEYLSTGKSVVVKRTGRPEKVESVFPGVDKEIEISPWDLHSMQTLRQVFGEGIEEYIEWQDVE